MGHEPQCDWTTRTLKEYVDTRMMERDKRFDDTLIAQEKATAASLQAAQNAVTKAEASTERRFEGVNEFRAQLADQAATLMPRAETTVLITALTEKIEALSVRVNANADRLSKTVAHGSGLVDGYGYLIGFVGAIAAIVAIAIALLH